MLQPERDGVAGLELEESRERICDGLCVIIKHCV